MLDSFAVRTKVSTESGQLQLNDITGEYSEAGYQPHDCFSSNLPVG